MLATCAYFVATALYTINNVSIERYPKRYPKRYFGFQNNKLEPGGKSSHSRCDFLQLSLNPPRAGHCGGLQYNA
jgi:hypothetical protein